MTLNLYKTYGTRTKKTPGPLEPLRDAGFNSRNVTRDVKLYEASNGTIKACKGKPPDLRVGGRCENVGFWNWLGKEYYKLYEKHGLRTAAEANLNALKERLK